MRAIPKSMLQQEGRLMGVVTDGWTTSDPEILTELKNIRIEPSSKVIRDKNNVEWQLAALLFFDCKNSSPKGTVFHEDQVVDFQGEQFRIISVEPLYDKRRLHHYEIGMVRYAGKSKG